MPIEQVDSESARPLRSSDRELLAGLAGADIAGKLTDAECSRLNARIAQLIADMRQKDFDAGWAAAIDHTVDYVSAFFAQNAKSH